MTKIILIQNFKLILARFTAWIDDELFCKILFFIKNRRFLNIDKPQSFSEKLYWLKINGELDKYSRYVDKVAVKEYVKSKNLGSILIPTLAVYDSADDFSLSSLPDRFVLKLNNASGYNLIVSDVRKFTEAKLKRLIGKWLKVNFYLVTREKQYAPIRSRVIAEMFVEQKPGVSLVDYKIYCFQGRPHMIQVISGRSGMRQEHTYYDTSWKLLNISRKEYPKGIAVDRPERLDDMLRYSELLAPECSFCRVDFYCVQDKVLFGEITFIPANANLNFIPAGEDRLLASLISI